MKRWRICFFQTAAVCTALLLAACSGSDNYRGEWKGMDSDNRRQQVVFAEQSFTVRNAADGTEKTYDYRQHAVHYENGQKYYGIRLSGGEELQIYFPFPNDDSRALLQAADDTVLLTLSRKDYIPPQKFWSLPE